MQFRPVTVLDAFYLACIYEHNFSLAFTLRHITTDVDIISVESICSGDAKLEVQESTTSEPQTDKEVVATHPNVVGDAVVDDPYVVTDMAHNESIQNFIFAEDRVEQTTTLLNVVIEDATPQFESHAFGYDVGHGEYVMSMNVYPKSSGTLFLTPTAILGKGGTVLHSSYASSNIACSNQVFQSIIVNAEVEVALSTTGNIQDNENSCHHVSSQVAFDVSPVVLPDFVSLAVSDGGDISVSCFRNSTAGTMLIQVLCVPHYMAADVEPAQGPTASNHSFVTALGYSYHSNESSVNNDSGMLQRDGFHETVALSTQCSLSVTTDVVTGFSSLYVSNEVPVAASAVTNMGVADMGDLSPIPSSTNNHTLFVNQVAEKYELLQVSLVPPTSLIQVKFARTPLAVVEFGLQEEDEAEGATVCYKTPSLCLKVSDILVRCKSVSIGHIIQGWPPPTPMQSHFIGATDNSAVLCNKYSTEVGKKCPVARVLQHWAADHFALLLFHSSLHCHSTFHHASDTLLLWQNPITTLDIALILYSPTTVVYDYTGFVFLFFSMATSNMIAISPACEGQAAVQLQIFHRLQHDSHNQSTSYTFKCNIFQVLLVFSHVYICLCFQGKTATVRNSSLEHRSTTVARSDLIYSICIFMTSLPIVQFVKRIARSISTRAIDVVGAGITLFFTKYQHYQHFPRYHGVTKFCVVAYFGFDPGIISTMVIFCMVRSQYFGIATDGLGDCEVVTNVYDESAMSVAIFCTYVVVNMAARTSDIFMVLESASFPHLLGILRYQCPRILLLLWHISLCPQVTYRWLYNGQHIQWQHQLSALHNKAHSCSKLFRLLDAFVQSEASHSAGQFHKAAQYLELVSHNLIGSRVDTAIGFVGQYTKGTYYVTTISAQAVIATHSQVDRDYMTATQPSATSVFIMWGCSSAQVVLRILCTAVPYDDDQDQYLSILEAQSISVRSIRLVMRQSICRPSCGSLLGWNSWLHCIGFMNCNCEIFLGSNRAKLQAFLLLWQDNRCYGTSKQVMVTDKIQGMESLVSSIPYIHFLLSLHHWHLFLSMLLATIWASVVPLNETQEHHLFQGIYYPCSVGDRLSCSYLILFGATLHVLDGMHFNFCKQDLGSSTSSISMQQGLFLLVF